MALARVGLPWYCTKMDTRSSQSRYDDSPTNRLREWRKKRGWSLKRLGAAVGLSYGQVGKLERGDEDMSLARMRQFAKVLMCSPADLLPIEDRESTLPPLFDLRDDGTTFERFDPNKVAGTAWPVRLWREGGEAFSPRGCLWFGRDFLSRLKLDPTACEVIDVHDSSMAPAFPTGATCLIDHKRQRREPEAVYAVELEGAPLIRRAHKKGNRWHLLADNPDAEWEVPWDATIQSLGRVVWTSRVTVS